MTFPIFHRGWTSNGQDENTRAAIIGAKNRGGGVEIDIRPTADDYAVLHHDATWDRMTNETGRIIDTDFATATSYNTKGGYPVISFKAAVLAASDIVMLVDVKNSGWSNDALARLGITVAECKAENRVYFFNNNLDFLARLRDNSPNVQIIYRPMDKNYDPYMLMNDRMAGALAISESIGTTRNRNFRGSGMLLFAQKYSVTNKSTYDTMLSRAINGIVVDSKDYLAWS